MRVLSLLLMCAAVALAKTTWDQLDGYTFEDYKMEYEKSYTLGSEEHDMRKALFEKRLAAIKEHNADTTKTWKNGVNKFTDMTDQERSRYLGRRNKPAPKLGAMAPPPVDPNFKAPDSIDWRTKGVVTPVKNQGGCGSCWAFAATESIESAVAIATGNLMVLSEQNMVSCTPNPDKCGGTGGCQGATAELGFDYVKDKGISSEKDYPYRGITGKCEEKTKATKISGYVKNPQNKYAPLLNAIATVGPQAISIDASGIFDYEIGEYAGCSKDADIDHGVQLVGYGTNSATGDYWLVRNSWGAGWGNKGYFNLKRFGSDDAYCGTDHSPSDGTGCAGGPSSVPVCGMCAILYDTSYPTYSSSNSSVF